MRDKTKDAFLRPMFPHISDSVKYDYLAEIFQRFSVLLISIAPIIFELLQPIKGTMMKLSGMSVSNVLISCND